MAAPAVGATLYCALFAVLLHVDFRARELVLLAASVLLFAGLVAALRRAELRGRRTAWLILVVAAALQVIALTQKPLTSDDAYRYSWDAKVQLAGIDPYRYAPSDPALDSLRDGDLFGASSACTYPVDGGCTAINRPTVHTIYPPVAEAVFVIGRSSGLDARHGLLPFQLLAAAGALATTVVLLRRAIRSTTALWPVALWAWCPVVVVSFGNDAHIDWLAVLASVVALGAATTGRTLSAGVALGAAIATKLYPALLLAPLLRRRPWAVVVALVTVVVVYVPHLIAVGTDVVGFLPGYLNEEGYSSGTRLLLLGAVLPHPADTIAGVLVLVAAACWAWRRADPTAPEQTATVLAGVTILVTTPSYGWYTVLLIALVVMSARYEWMVLALAPAFVYARENQFPHAHVPNALVYFFAALGTVACWWWRVSHRVATT